MTSGIGRNGHVSYELTTPSRQFGQQLNLVCSKYQLQADVLRAVGNHDASNRYVVKGELDLAGGTSEDRRAAMRELETRVAGSKITMNSPGVDRVEPARYRAAPADWLRLRDGDNSKRGELNVASEQRRFQIALQDGDPAAAYAMRVFRGY